MATAKAPSTRKPRSKPLPALGEAIASVTPAVNAEEVKTSVVEQAEKAAIAAPPPKPPTPTPTPTPTPVSTPAPAAKAPDKPNKPIESYRMAGEGKVYKRNATKGISPKASGVNRFAVLITHKDGATEADLRHVNPRGFEYSGSGAGYVAQNCGFNILVKDGRYQVASNEDPTVLDDELRDRLYQMLGGDLFYQNTIDYIRNNAVHGDYATFTPSVKA